MTGSVSLATVRPDRPVYRIGYRPDPWRWTPWEFAPFHGRWDDSAGLFRVVYAGDSLLSCYLEVLAAFRPDPLLLADLNEIDGSAADDDYPTTGPGVVPLTWLHRRALGTATLTGTFIDVGAKESLAWLRPRMAARLVHYGVPDLDGAAIRSTVPRQLTQEIAHLLYDAPVGKSNAPDGIRFESRHGDNVVLWAVFERPAAGDDDYSHRLANRTVSAVGADDPDLRQALRLHGLRLAG